MNSADDTAIIAGSSSMAGDIPVESSQIPHSPSIYEVFFIGIGLVVGGQFMVWDAALALGLWPFLLSFTIVSLGYLSLTACLGEMTSILPFTGGSYGYIRCSLGPLPGYLCGICEAVAYIAWTASALTAIGHLLEEIFSAHLTVSHPVCWLMFLACALPSHLLGGAAPIRLGALLGGASLVIAILYLLSNANQASMMHYESNRSFGPIGLEAFFRYFPLAGALLRGIEPLVIACKAMPKADFRAPRIMLAVLLSSVLLGFGIICMTCSTAVGPVPRDGQPLLLGLQGGLRVSRQGAAALMLLPTAASAYGFMNAFSHQLQSMAQSGLLPRYLKKTLRGTPWAALLTGSLLAYLSALMAHLFMRSDDNAESMLFCLGMLAACVLNVNTCRAYLVYQLRYKLLGRMFINPFGRFSAWLGAAVFALMAVCLCFFHDHACLLLVIFTAICWAACAYYALYADYTQSFSEEVQFTFYEVYLWTFDRIISRLDNKPPPRKWRCLCHKLFKNKVSDAGQSIVINAPEQVKPVAPFPHDEPEDTLSTGGIRNPSLRAILPEEEDLYYTPVVPMPVSQPTGNKWSICDLLPE